MRPARQPELAATEISAGRDDYTVIILMEVDPQDQAALTEAMALPDEPVHTVPGYRSHSILRGIDGTFVVNYAQRESKKLHDAFHELPEGEHPADARRARSVLRSRDANACRVVRTRSAR